MIEDNTQVTTMEKDYLLYKGEPVLEVNAFLIQLAQQNLTEEQFAEELKNNIKLPKYISVKSFINLYNTVQRF